MVSVAKIGVNLRCDNVVETGQTTLWRFSQRVAPGDTSRAPEPLRFNWTPAKYREGLVRAFLSIPSRRGRMSTLKGMKGHRKEYDKGVGDVSIIKIGRHTDNFWILCNCVHGLYNNENFDVRKKRLWSGETIGKVDIVRDILNQQCFWGLSYNRSCLLSWTKQRYFNSIIEVYTHRTLARHLHHWDSNGKWRSWMSCLFECLTKCLNKNRANSWNKAKKKRPKEKTLWKTRGGEKRSVQRPSSLERSSWSFHRRWH